MSLINKMLQDLDARGFQKGAVTPGELRPVPARERGLPPRTQLIVGGGLAVLMVAGLAGWYLSRAPAKPAPIAPVVVMHPPPLTPMRSMVMIRWKSFTALMRAIWLKWKRHCRTFSRALAPI